MEILISSAQLYFSNGVLKLSFFSTILDDSTRPDVSGIEIQVLPSDGATLDSTEEEIKAIALKKIKDKETLS